MRIDEMFHSYQLSLMIIQRYKYIIIIIQKLHFEVVPKDVDSLHRIGS
jgi:hypothetical protein